MVTSASPHAVIVTEADLPSCLPPDTVPVNVPEEAQLQLLVQARLFAASETEKPASLWSMTKLPDTILRSARELPVTTIGAVVRVATSKILRPPGPVRMRSMP